MSQSNGGPRSSPSNKRLRDITIRSGRRLVEYFCIISSIPRPKEELPLNFSSSSYSPSRRYFTARPSSSEEEGEKVAGTMEVEEEFLEEVDFEPVITGRYPLEDREGNPLQESVTAFCVPRGPIRIREESSMPKTYS
mmetsp:Transcript_43331/g.65482  ORF Transcript_43331/g.65482 Transcript_43331/m.65482 type:complete len:137 (+) Transcript_43331:45-455(+)